MGSCRVKNLQFHSWLFAANWASLHFSLELVWVLFIKGTIFSEGLVDVEWLAVISLSKAESACFTNKLLSVRRQFFIGSLSLNRCACICSIIILSETDINFPFPTPINVKLNSLVATEERRMLQHLLFAFTNSRIAFGPICFTFSNHLADKMPEMTFS